MKKIPLILCVFAASCLFIGYVSWRTYQAGSAACAAVAAEVDKLNPWRCVPREGVTFVDVTNSSSSTNQTQGSVLTNISFDTPIVLKLDQEATFIDGVKITLKEITDSRCLEDVVCIWAGELSIVFRVFGGKAVAVHDVRLSSVTAPTLADGGYLFKLIGVTPTAATFTLSTATASPDAVLGVVSGTVLVGPVCPVERLDNPCEVPPQTYTSRSVVVYQVDQTTLVRQQPLSSTGTYSLSLAPGTYWLQITPAGIGEGEKKRVIVTADSLQVVDFDIDTGIR